MVSYSVKLHKNENKTFQDVSSVGIRLTPTFISRLMEATKTKKNYQTNIAGITEVRTPKGKYDGSSFFILEIDKKTNKCELLFEILPGESSKLIGINPNLIGASELRNLVMDVSNYKIQEVVTVLI